MAVEATAISTPLESVPLYKVATPSSVLIILLKSSHAVSSSPRFNLGTPKNKPQPHFNFEILIYSIAGLDH